MKLISALAFIGALIAMSACADNVQRKEPVPSETPGPQLQTRSLTKEDLIGIWAGEYDGQIIVYCFRKDNLASTAEFEKLKELDKFWFFQWKVDSGHLFARQNADDPPPPPFTDYGGQIQNGELHLSEQFIFGGNRTVIQNWSWIVNMFNRGLGYIAWNGAKGELPQHVSPPPPHIPEPVLPMPNMPRWAPPPTQPQEPGGSQVGQPRDPCCEDTDPGIAGLEANCFDLEIPISFAIPISVGFKVCSVNYDCCGEIRNCASFGGKVCIGVDIFEIYCLGAININKLQTFSKWFMGTFAAAVNNSAVNSSLFQNGFDSPTFSGCPNCGHAFYSKVCITFLLWTGCGGWAASSTSGGGGFDPITTGQWPELEICAEAGIRKCC